MTRRYLLDTNHLSAAVNRVSPLRDRLRRSHRSGAVLGTCVPVLCELEAGFQQTDDPAGLRRALVDLLGFVRVWPLEYAVARLYGEWHAELRRRGRVLSSVDIMLAALVQQMNLTLLTADRDFEALPEIRTENWLL
jgi:tRNA(fMet)-specific endonuclease VapC